MKSNTKLNILALVCAIALVALSVFAAWPFSDTLGWGVDFAGGTSTPFTADSSSAASDADLKVVRQRLSELGVHDARVSASDKGYTVEVPANQDVADDLAAAGKVYSAQLVRLDQVSDPETLIKISAGASGVKLADGTYTALATDDQIKGAKLSGYSYGSTTYYGVQVTLNSDASKALEDASSTLSEVSGQVALVVDGEVVATTTLSKKVTDGTLTFYSSQSQAEVKRLAAGIDTATLSAAYTAGDATDVAAPFTAQVALYLLIAEAAVVVVVAVALVVLARVPGLIAWVGWLVSASFQVGCVALLGRDKLFTPSFITLGAVGVSTLCSLAAFAMLSIKLRHRNNELAGLFSVSVKPLAVVLAANVVFACVAAFFPQFDLATAGAVLLAVLAWVVALVFVYLPLVRIMVEPGSRRSK